MSDEHTEVRDGELWWLSTEGAVTEDEFQEIRRAIQNVTDNPVVLSTREIEPMTEEERREYVEKLTDALDSE